MYHCSTLYATLVCVIVIGKRSPISSALKWALIQPWHWTRRGGIRLVIRLHGWELRKSMVAPFLERWAKKVWIDTLRNWWSTLQYLVFFHYLAVNIYIYILIIYTHTYIYTSKYIYIYYSYKYIYIYIFILIFIYTHITHIYIYVYTYRFFKWKW